MTFVLEVDASAEFTEALLAQEAQPAVRMVSDRAQLLEVEDAGDAWEGNVRDQGGRRLRLLFEGDSPRFEKAEQWERGKI